MRARAGSWVGLRKKRGNATMIAASNNESGANLIRATVAAMYTFRWFWGAIFFGCHVTAVRGHQILAGKNCQTIPQFEPGTTRARSSARPTAQAWMGFHGKTLRAGACCWYIHLIDLLTCIELLTYFKLTWMNVTRKFSHFETPETLSTLATLISV